MARRWKPPIETLPAIELVALILDIAAPGFTWLRAVVAVVLIISLFDRLDMFDLKDS